MKVLKQLKAKGKTSFAITSFEMFRLGVLWAYNGVLTKNGNVMYFAGLSTLVTLLLNFLFIKWIVLFILCTVWSHFNGGADVAS